jgi:hypothetical protein
MRLLSDTVSSAPHRLLQARSSRGFWLVSNGLALPLSCSAYSQPGKHTSMSLIRPQKKLFARCLPACVFRSRLTKSQKRSVWKVKETTSSIIIRLPPPSATSAEGKGCNADWSNSCALLFARRKTRKRFFARATWFRRAIRSKDLRKRSWFLFLLDPAEIDLVIPVGSDHRAAGFPIARDGRLGTTFARVATWCAEPFFHETQSTFEKIVSSFHYTEQATSRASR